MDCYEYWVIKKSGSFDPIYYLLNNPDVRVADVDPLMHFIKHGWQEGRSPSKDFNVNFYLDTNADVKSSGMNPLVHYIRYGKAEGRSSLSGITYSRKPRLFRKPNALISKRLTKNIINMSVSYIRTYGFKVFIKKLINNLLPRVNTKDISAGRSLRIYHDKFISNPILVEKEIQPLDVKISAVIPTKNAGSEFEFLIKMLKQQKGIREIELVIVDSGSTDDTLLIAKQHGAKIIQIKPEQFSHSFSRNLGAENASGDYLLFMVQDALPPSRTWLYELFIILKDKNVSAISCAESPRENADLFYRFLCWNHYNFLDVNNGDRIFQLPESKDQVSLRKNGQLSDLACLISKETFSEYKFRRDYGEDLDLGLRLIKDGKRIAFSGEIRVIHSHNRPAYYFLKRGYVDNLFLKDMFSDFVIPKIDQEDLIADIAFTYEFVNDFIQKDLESLKFPIENSAFEDLVVRAFEKCNGQTFPSKLTRQMPDYKDQQFVTFVEELINQGGFKKQRQEYNGILVPALFTHVNIMLDYLDTVYKYIGENLAEEIKTCLFKQLGIMIGTYLAFGYLKRTGNEPIDLEKLHTILKAGV
ncbi:glycosyltransferase family 2 protein [Longilinea arvoryzae]|nr:glycosyltransferase [Longilinea arvoryzae]